MALVAVVSVAERQPASLAGDVIGIIVVLSCYALMAWLLFHLLFSAPLRETPRGCAPAVGVLFSLLPLALIGAVAFGYYYTALKLTDRLIDTLYLLIILLIVEATLVRGLSVARHGAWPTSAPWPNARRRRGKPGWRSNRWKSPLWTSSRSTSSPCA